MRFFLYYLMAVFLNKTQFVLKMSTNGRRVGVGFVTPSWFSDTDQHIWFGEEEKNVSITMVRNQTSYDRTGLTCVCVCVCVCVICL